jgi:hypothetical protein
MSDWFAIRAALRSTLVGIGTLPAARAWENIEAGPGPTTPSVEEAMIPVEERPASVGFIEQIGIYQITLVYPLRAGTKAAEDIIDDILAAFRPASSHGGVVRVDRAERNPPVIAGNEYRLPVSIRWRAYQAY